MLDSARRLLEAYASYIGHAMWIFISFFVLAAFPLLFGMEAYGKFAATTALTFIAQKVIDLTVESNIANRNYRNTIRSAGYAAVLVLAPLIFIDATSESAVFKVEYLLLVSLVASNIVLNMSFQLLTAVSRAVYLTIFSTLTVGISLAFWLAGSQAISTILTIINFSGCIVGLQFLSRAISNDSAADKNGALEVVPRFSAQLLDVIYRFLFSTFALFMTFGSILIASSKFDYTEIGIFRISLTIVAIGNFISPINPKEMYRIARSIESWQGLASFFRQNQSAYLVLIAMWLVVAGVCIFVFGDMVGVLMFSICLYAASLYSTVIEKVFLSRQGIWKASFFVSAYTAVSVAIMFIPQTLELFALTITAIILLYPVYLAAILRRGFLRTAIVPVALSGSMLAVAAISRGIV